MKAQAKVFLPCGHCDGTGQKEAAKLSETLSDVGSRWVTTQQLARAAGVSGENMANRLAELLRLGLVERRGNRPHEWKRKPGKESP